jgi:hypothetical protein
MELRVAALPQTVRGNASMLPLDDSILDVRVVAVVREGERRVWIGRVTRARPLAIEPLGAPPGKKIVFFTWERILAVTKSSWSEVQAIRAWQNRGLAGAETVQRIGVRVRRPERETQRRKPESPEPPDERNFGMAAPTDEVDDELEALGG